MTWISRSSLPRNRFSRTLKGNATVTRSASGKLHILPRHSWTTTSPLAASQKSPVDSSPGSSPDADAADTAEATPERGEQWRLKQVSRGTSTDPQKEEEGHQLEERLAAQEMRLQRLQEQIAVRAVIQPQQDWQREKEAYRLEHELYKEKSSRERQTLRSQVSALKDELLRQRQEQTLLREKHQREMEAALRTQQGKTSQDEQLLRARHAKELEQTRETLRHQHELDLERETTAFQVFCKEQEEYFHSRLQQQAEETQLAVERQQERVRREQFVQLDALYTVVLQETERRRQLEGTESADRQALFHTVHHHQLVARLSRQVRRLETEKESILANFSVQNKTWEKYCNDLQEEYNDALRHAEEEVSRLLVGMEHLKKEDTPRSSAAHGRDVACDPIGQKEVHYETALSIVQEPSALPVEETATVYVSPTDAYWKKVCARLQSEVESLQAAERAHLSSQATLTQENTRLLAQLHTLQSEQTSRQQAEQEKENLLRTLHSLKDDLQHKDDALDQLEEEAREKLEEKRCRIALLEEELALQREEREKSVAQSVAYKEEVEQTKKQLAELEEKFKVVWWQCCGSGQADEGEPMMSPPLSWQDSTPNATLLSTLPLHKKINEKDKLLQSLRLERQELVQGLTVARDQLLRSAAIEEQLQRRVGEMEQSVQQLKEEKRKWEEKCNVLEESYKQKQKQTWQTFVQIMGEAAP
ncbi:hypothetical protein ADEAN_000470700 [Angomonas deanei]|uniref:Uncharacterized protein n=1 Tax=Angomonas deanei TaxID=59799 RepID=A0A7G2CCI7_9TRYP|nr:hypothetical protein ADEAN_000470700 [Angomonas deanei]